MGGHTPWSRQNLWLIWELNQMLATQWRTPRSPPKWNNPESRRFVSSSLGKEFSACSPDLPECINLDSLISTIVNVSDFHFTGVFEIANHLRSPPCPFHAGCRTYNTNCNTQVRNRSKVTHTRFHDVLVQLFHALKAWPCRVLFTIFNPTTDN